VTNAPLERGPGDHRWCDARIAALEAEIVDLRVRLEKLEEQVRQNSQNSSRPASTNPPGMKRPPRKPTSGRKPGGQPGHEAHLRELLPDDKVNHVVDHGADACDGCGGALEKTDSAPLRVQVVDAPPIQPDVTEHRFHTHWCPRCQKGVRPPWPEGVPKGAFGDCVVFGPRVDALVSLLTGEYHLGKRPAAEFLGSVLGVELTKGTVCACEAATSESLAAPVAEAHEYVQAQPVANADETGWRQRRGKAWVWVVVTSLVTVFRIHLHRSEEAAKELLGNFKGILGTDRAGAYAFWDFLKRQLCWAHLKRDFTKIFERGGTSKRIGGALLKAEKLLFRWWHKLQRGEIQRSTFQRYVAPLEAEVEALLVQGAACRNESTARTCAEMLKVFPAMWTFVDVEGVEPTNNAAERAIRPAVLWRKVSFGTHSEAGSRFVERVMTVAATLKQQGRNVFEYLVAAREAALHGRPAPSLLPAYTSPQVERLRA